MDRRQLTLNTGGLGMRGSALRASGLAVAGLLTALCTCLGARAQGSPPSSAQAPARGLDGSHATTSLRPITSLPFELSRNRILLRNVSLGGPERLVFVFDSGAGASGLDAAVWDRLGLKGDDQVVASGAGGTMTTEVKHNVPLTIGPVALGPTTLMKGLTRPTVSQTGESSSGTIGVDLLRRYVVTVDFVERKLDIYDPTTYIHDGSADTLDIIFWNDIVHVAGAFTTPAGEAVRGEFALDLGNPGGLTLEPSVVEKHSLLAAKGNLTPLTLRGATGGTVNGFRTVYPSLTLGKSVLPGIPVVLLETPLMGRTLPWTGFIGLEVLRRFHVTFDYEHHKLYLAKNRWFDDPSREAVTAGAGSTPEGGAAPASWSAAEAAVRAGDAARLRELLSSEPELVSQANSQGRTLLHNAAFAGQIEIVRLLVEHGAPLSTQEKANGATPLHFAVYGGHREVIRILVAGGADLAVKDGRSMTPEGMAAVTGKSDLIELLRR